MDCNRKRRTDPVDSRLTRRLPAMSLLMPALGMLPALCVMPGNAFAATEVNWLDIESRIQYAYYTQDVRALHRVLDALNATEVTDATKAYYAGLANYRLTQLAPAPPHGSAKENAENCVASLDLTLKDQKDSPDALALQAACLEALARQQQAWRAPLAASRSGSQSLRAKQLAPHNPRVLLLAASGDYQRSRAGTPARDRAIADLKRAAAAFELERQEAEHTPGWGAAEAYVYLARAYLDRGSSLDARDALERALLIAPEYAEARQLMSKLTS